MPLENLIARMEQRDTPDTPCNPGGVSREPAYSGACTPATPDTPATDESEAMQLARHAIEQAAFTDEQKNHALPTYDVTRPLPDSGRWHGLKPLTHPRKKTHERN
jgi:hypothetical protein